MPTVTFLPSQTAIEFEAPQTLLRLALDAGLTLQTGCVIGFCGSDLVRVVEGREALEPPTLTEQETLADLGAPPNVRLACVAKATGDCVIEVPERAQVVQDEHAPHWIRKDDKFKVLVVDLGEEQRAVLRRELAAQPCGVEIVTDGAEAKDRLRYHEFDLICLRLTAHDDAVLDSGQLVLHHLKLYGTRTQVLVFREAGAMSADVFRHPTLMSHVVEPPFRHDAVADVIDMVFG